MQQSRSDHLLGKHRESPFDWPVVVKECSGAMHAKARSVLGQGVDPAVTPDDVVQAAWLEIFKTPVAVIGNIEAFAVTVTWRRALDVCRRAPRTTPLAEQADGTVPSPEELYVLAEEEMRLRDLVRDLIDVVLDSRERRIVRGHMKGLSLKEMAAVEGVTPQRVGQVLAGAFGKLHRAAISRRGEEGGR